MARGSPSSESESAGSASAARFFGVGLDLREGLGGGLRSGLVIDAGDGGAGFLLAPLNFSFSFVVAEGGVGSDASEGLVSVGCLDREPNFNLRVGRGSDMVRKGGKC